MPAIAEGSLAGINKMIRREHLEEIVRKNGGRIIWHRGTKEWMDDDMAVKTGRG